MTGHDTGITGHVRPEYPGALALSGTAHAYPFRVQVDKRPTQSNVLGINHGYAPVTVVLEFSALAADKSNVRPQDVPTTTRRILVPANTTVVLTALHPVDPSLPYWAKIRPTWYFGDESIKTPEPAIYRLPYPDGVSAKTSRSLDALHGNFKHQFDIDFELKDWTPVCAARAGIVFEVSGIQNDDGEPSEPRQSEFTKEDPLKGDFIRVLHDDGTYAEYANLMGSSALVRPGQKVGEGDKIAYAGNSAEAARSHLHFGVYRLTPVTGSESMPWLLKTKHAPKFRPDPEQLYVADYSDKSDNPQPEPIQHQAPQSGGRSDVGETFNGSMQKHSEPTIGVVHQEDKEEPKSAAEKPRQPKWAWALMGLGLVAILWYQRKKTRPSQGQAATQEKQ
ncbi:M23 family metallopeptidase [Duganella vulcania]|uniref:Peptidoglycan DD-metalloendopeptidase family protein n=1 Tax=Duganella vulcania TaxID=2692166 RepID=A0A845GH06_9BURK|nr:M23 family metallopeptidase [Duganella vulcania]MYM92800.1 peptidoglycan DD-metalloendopeptidase family protein [Duganella vulcania]